MFHNGPGDRGSIRSHIKDSKHGTQHYKVRIKGKLNNPGKKVAPFPTPRCSSY